VNVQLVDDPVSAVEQAAGVATAGDEVTVKPVRAAPPLEAGAVQEMTELALAFDVAVTAVGAVGTVAGVAYATGVEAALVPAELVAVTVNA
jgi:1-aminocyclopropane-1-carboxylate deaminase/D-cysteine desulfhydrase-like pyridoxal-dependent ACC family enzyme